MRILVDADACPVKEEVLKVAARYDLPVFIVSNGGLRPSRDPMITNVTVAAGADEADNWIAEKTEAGDVVVTADIPLAARVLEKSASAVGPTGRVFDESTIGMALAMRDLKQQIRESTQTQTRNRPFEARDRSAFLQTLDKLVTQRKNKKTSQRQT